MADAVLTVGLDVREADRALGKFTKALQAVATGLVVRGLVDLADAATSLNNKLKLVTTSTAETSDAFETVIKIARDTRTPLEAVTTTYFRLSRASEDLGISQERVANITTTLSQAVTSSGLSAQEAAGPLLQLSQAFQSGRLAGDEFRSVSEGLPQVLTALATHLKVPKGALKKLASEGKITGRVLVEALEGAADKVATDFGKTTSTIGQAIEVLKTSTVGFVNTLDQTTGASAKVSEAIINISEVLTKFSADAERVGVIFQALGEIIMIVFLRKVFVIVRSVFVALGEATTQFAGDVLEIAISFSTIWGRITRTSREAINWIISLWGKAISYMKGGETILSKILRGIGMGLVTLAVTIGELAASFPGLLTAITMLETGFSMFFDTVEVGFEWVINQAVALKNHIQDILWAIGAMDERGNKPLINIDGPAPIWGMKQQESPLLFDNLPEKKAMPASTFNQALEDRKKIVDNITQDYAKQVGLLKYTGKELEWQTMLAEKQMEIGGALTTVEQGRLRYLFDIIKATEEERELREQILTAGEEQLKQVMRGADPRIAVEQDYIDAKITLENYFMEVSYISAQTQQESLSILEDNYRMKKFDAEVELENRLFNMRKKNAKKEAYERFKTGGWSHGESMGMADQLADYEMKTDTEKNQWIIKNASDTFDQLGTMSREAFEVAKAANIAEAIMNTYVGVTKAFAQGGMFGFITGALILGTGLAQVSAIKSQQYRGRAIGGPVNPDSSYLVGETGTEMFTPNTPGHISPLSGNKTVNITFEINAVDSSSIDELLVERKPMIVSMIRKATEDNGYTSLV